MLFFFNDVATITDDSGERRTNEHSWAWGQTSGGVGGGGPTANKPKYCACVITTYEMDVGGGVLFPSVLPTYANASFRTCNLLRVGYTLIDVGN